jgi:hypothetical protein
MQMPFTWPLSIPSRITYDQKHPEVGHVTSRTLSAVTTPKSTFIHGKPLLPALRDPRTNTLKLLHRLLPKSAPKVWSATPFSPRVQLTPKDYHKLASLPLLDIKKYIPHNLKILHILPMALHTRTRRHNQRSTPHLRPNTACKALTNTSATPLNSCMNSDLHHPGVMQFTITGVFEVLAALLIREASSRTRILRGVWRRDICILFALSLPSYRTI